MGMYIYCLVYISDKGNKKQYLQFWVLSTDDGIHVKLCYCIFENHYDFFLSWVTSNGFEVFHTSCLVKGKCQFFASSM